MAEPTLYRHRYKVPAHRMRPKVSIVPDALYDVEETAHILGFGARPNTVYEIPEDQLVPTRVGPRRGKKMFRGRDILNYMDAGRRAPTSRRIQIA